YFTMLPLRHLSSRDPRHLHSFPTRRSSDLDERVALPLRLGLETERANAIVGRRLNTIVGEFALGPTCRRAARWLVGLQQLELARDRKSTRLNSSHQIISYAVFCLKKKKKTN